MVVRWGLSKITGLVLGTVMTLVLSAHAQERPGWVPLVRIEQRLKELDEFYGNIPSAVNCRTAMRGVERIICESDYLQRAELLSTRASAYAEENATKSEVNHKRYKGALPRQCTSEDCIYAFFMKKIDSAIGGMSPYESGNNGTAGATPLSGEAIQLGQETPLSHVRRFFAAFLNPNNAGASSSPINKAPLRSYFSKGMVADWANATSADYPVYNGHPVSGRQEGSVSKLLKVWPIAYTGQVAVIGVSVEIDQETVPPSKSTETHQYLLIREEGQWRIDDIAQDISPAGLSVRAVLRRELDQRMASEHR